MNSFRFFLDTSYVVALINPHDKYHKKAKELSKQLSTAREILITEAAIVEVGDTLSRSTRSYVISFVKRCYATSNIKVIPIDKELIFRAVKFYDSHKDKEWGLTDCISFIVMQDYGINKALTTDKHFEQAGFQALLHHTSYNF